ncbi:MAG: hypothetical protein L0Y72_12435 [Gemmataceae bacterium]|nr:hypothetical protein [Gemmataceae bacterium]MCI0739846.1 hypothetical protein [Gemmataceae bacterium]
MPWRRLFFLGFLAAIGYAAYVFSAPLPRWQVEGKYTLTWPWNDSFVVTSSRPVQMIDVQTGNTLWRKSLDSLPFGTGKFTSDSKHFLLDVDQRSALAYFNSDTGAIDHYVRASSTVAGAFVRGESSHYSQLMWSSKERHFNFERGGYRKALRVPWVNWTFELGTVDELAIVDIEKRAVVAEISAEKIHESRIYDDGPFLVTCHRQNGVDYLACWDLPPRRNWLWIVGPPAGVGIGLMALKLGYRRLRKGRN